MTVSRLLLISLAGRTNQHQRDVIDFLIDACGQASGWPDCRRAKFVGNTVISCLPRYVFEPTELSRRHSR